jgi:hypothetical protein
VNLGDVKVRVYRTFGDEANVQIADPDIVRWVNDAQRDIVRQNETVLQTTGYASAVTNQQVYTLPSDLMVLRGLHYKRSGDVTFYRMRDMNQQEFDEYIDGWDGTLYQSGWPQVYFVYSNTITLFPIPNETVTSNIKIYYSRMPKDVAIDTDVVDLPLQYHNAVVSYVLKQAFMVDEDWAAAQQVAQNMEADIKILRENENWGARESYPRITAMFDDEW